MSPSVRACFRESGVLQRNLRKCGTIVPPATPLAKVGAHAQRGRDSWRLSRLAGLELVLAPTQRGTQEWQVVLWQEGWPPQSRGPATPRRVPRTNGSP